MNSNTTALAGGPQRASMGASDPGRAQVRILCVEDNECDFLLLQEHLKDAPFDKLPALIHARSVSEAKVKILESEDLPFHVILLDLNLPDSHGPDTYHRIRELAPQTAITILSGTTDHELALSFVQKGAQDYLPKDSINGDLLMRSILYAVERQRHRREMAELNERLGAAKLELETAQMQLIQAEKLDSLGRLAASVAHEVKNPLATIQMGVDYFHRRRSILGESASTMLDYMQEAISRAERIIHEMLDFSRSETLQLRPCSVNDLVTDAIHMVQHELTRRKVSVRTELTQQVPDVRADRSKLVQVIINLIINAAQAMPEGGVVEVRTMYGELITMHRDEGLREMDLLRPGDMVVVMEVVDHGAGIPPEILRRIFEPFFTTKPTGEGTGLGLPVAKRIVELHRGHLQLKNLEEGHGIRVRVILKADFSNVASTSSAATPQPSQATTS
ncbi:MAG: sensor histidine kinase [Verrucomicrobium sp.]|nr:ATP-binding protein [Verrucomicrobium sp.]